MSVVLAARAVEETALPVAMAAAHHSVMAAALEPLRLGVQVEPAVLAQMERLAYRIKAARAAKLLGRAAVRLAEHLMVGMAVETRPLEATGPVAVVAAARSVAVVEKPQTQPRTPVVAAVAVPVS